MPLTTLETIAAARAIGVTIRRDQGEYRVARKGVSANGAYFTPWLDDAANTAAEIAPTLPSQSTPTLKALRVFGKLARALSRHSV